MTKKFKNVKPNDYEISLIYKCPSCTCEHWLSIKQASTPGYMVVCDCDTTFKVKKVKSIQVVYDDPVVTKPDKPVVIETPKPSIDLTESCVKILMNYGFTKQESIDLVNQSYAKNPTEDVGVLIKLCISTFGATV